jgi:hypothetical protein
MNYLEREQIKESLRRLKQVHDKLIFLYTEGMTEILPDLNLVDITIKDLNARINFA